MRQTYAVLVVLVVAGCPPVETPTSDASVPGATAEAFCRSLAQARCEWERRCGTFSTEVPCLDSPVDCGEYYQPLLDAGVMRFSSSAAADCLSEWADAGCALAAGSWGGGFGPSVCRSVLVGTSGFGERCGLCGPGLTCMVSGADLCGSCVVDPTLTPRLPGTGEPCVSPIVDGAGCAGGLACLPGDGGTFCEPMLAAGAKCEGKVCARGLACQSAEGGATCQPLRELGQPCESGRACKWGLLCREGVCAPLKELGEPCVEFGECRSSVCSSNVRAQFARVGESCETVGCESGLFCRRADSVCAPRAGLGAACSDPAGCLVGMQCVEGTCRSSALECR